MSLRVELHGRVTISNDNSQSPTDIVFQSGDKSLIDSTSYGEGTSKVLSLSPSTVDQQVNLDAITSVAVLYLLAESASVSVKIVPTGKVLADVSALKLLQNCPLIVGSDIAAVYLSNSDSNSSAKVHLGAAGN
jgi:hypothetical protein